MKRIGQEVIDIISVYHLFPRLVLEFEYHLLSVFRFKIEQNKVSRILHQFRIFIEEFDREFHSIKIISVEMFLKHYR